jgi:hypothetical protein
MEAVREADLALYESPTADIGETYNSDESEWVVLTDAGIPLWEDNDEHGQS